MEILPVKMSFNQKPDNNIENLTNPFDAVRNCDGTKWQRPRSLRCSRVSEFDTMSSHINPEVFKLHNIFRMLLKRCATKQKT